jgi:hypothetical protein
MKSNQLVFLIILFTISSRIDSQTNTKKIKLTNSSYTLQEVLQIIGNQSGYFFSYNFKKINPKYPITVSKHCFNTVDDALINILPEGMKYTINQKFIIIQVSSKAKDFIHINQDNKTPKLDSNKSPLIQNNSERIENKTDGNFSSTDTLVDLQKENTITKTKASEISQQKKDSISNKIKRNASRFDSPTNQISRTESTSVSFGKNSKLLEIELSGFHLQGCGSVHIGYSKIYGIISCTSDIKQTTFIGGGIGSQLIYYNKSSLTTEISGSFLVGGSSYSSGVRANVLQIKPLINYRLFNRLDVFLGPELYLLQVTQNNLSNLTLLQNRIAGIGGVLGVKIDLAKKQQTGNLSNKKVM